LQVEGNPPMTTTLGELAELVGGRLVGDGDLEISGAAILRDAQAGDITLADHARLAPQLATSQAAAALVSLQFIPQGLPHIVVDDARRAFATIVTRLRSPRTNVICGIDPTAIVDSTAIVAASAFVGPAARIGPRAVIGDHVSIGARSILHGGVQVMQGTRIAEDCELFPNVVLYENTLLGPRVIIHAGSVLGAYGFGYEQVEGRHQRSVQLGYVEVEADVEIGAGTTIDRGTYAATRIGEGTKIDNQVMIAHNCRIGRHNLICSHVGIAGSCTTGDYVVLAGQVGLRDHVHIGDRAVICAQAGVMNDVPPGSTQVGSPAIAEREQMHVWAASYKLPEMRKQFKALQRIVQELSGPHAELSAGESGIHQSGTLPLRESA
jgi:UDP-3-O-[3-hydroxymyristoyl] glucosamine N-acyltransferase